MRPLSLTATNEGIFITVTIDAHEGRDSMTADVPNAFIQALMPELEPGEDRVMLKVTRTLVDMLVQLDPQTFHSYVVMEGKRKVIYARVLRAMYGQIIASLLWYKKFRSDLEGIGFKFNP